MVVSFFILHSVFVWGRAGHHIPIMSSSKKLESFLYKLVEKKLQLQKEKEKEASVSQSSKASVYGSKAYWDKRYRLGPLGDGSDVVDVADDDDENPKHDTDSSDLAPQEPFAENHMETATRAQPPREKRSSGVTNEWFLDYQALQTYINTHIPYKEKMVLLLGCGLSLLGEHMAKDGYKHVVGVDYSEICIQRMNNVPNKMCRYLVADVTAMSHEFEDETVDAVLDKATLDSLMQEGEEGVDEAVTVRKMLAETSRVLVPGGVYVCLSYGEPDDRVPLLMGNEQGHEAEYGWTLEHTDVLRKGAKARFYMYVIRKNQS